MFLLTDCYIHRTINFPINKHLTEEAIKTTQQSQETEKQPGNTARTGRSTHVSGEPSYTRTHSSLAGIKM